MRAAPVFTALMLAGCGAGNFHRVAIPGGPPDALYATRITREGGDVIASTAALGGLAVVGHEEFMRRHQHRPLASESRVAELCPNGFDRIGEGVVIDEAYFARYRCRT